MCRARPGGCQPQRRQSVDRAVREGAGQAEHPPTAHTDAPTETDALHALDIVAAQAGDEGPGGPVPVPRAYQGYGAKPAPGLTDCQRFSRRRPAPKAAQSGPCTVRSGRGPRKDPPPGPAEHGGSGPRSTRLLTSVLDLSGRAPRRLRPRAPSSGCQGIGAWRALGRGPVMASASHRAEHDWTSAGPKRTSMRTQWRAQHRAQRSAPASMGAVGLRSAPPHGSMGSGEAPAASRLGSGGAARAEGRRRAKSLSSGGPHVLALADTREAQRAKSLKACGPLVRAETRISTACTYPDVLKRARARERPGGAVLRRRSTAVSWSCLRPLRGRRSPRRRRPRGPTPAPG